MFYYRCAFCVVLEYDCTCWSSRVLPVVLVPTGRWLNKNITVHNMIVPVIFSTCIFVPSMCSGLTLLLEIGDLILDIKQMIIAEDSDETNNV